MLENKFQASLIKELKQMFKGCVVLKTDANYIQGFPDLLILFENKWAALECKQSQNSRFRPNQEYYIDLLGSMSFCSVIYPEIKEEVLYELQQAFETRRSSRVPKR